LIQTVHAGVGDIIARLHVLDFIGAGPRSPQSGAPHTYVITKAFLSHYAFDTLSDMPDMEALEDAGLLSKDRLLAGEFPIAGDDDPLAPDPDETEEGGDDDFEEVEPN
jgi:segregation and condensation protein B